MASGSEPQPETQREKVQPDALAVERAAEQEIKRKRRKEQLERERAQAEQVGTAGFVVWHEGMG